MPADQIDAPLAVARELWQRNRVAEAEAVVRELVLREPRHEGAAMLLAEVLRNEGRLSAASEVLLHLCRANGFGADICLRAARFVQQCDRHPIATEICEGVLARNATPSAELLALAGHVAREAGDFETARARYLAALDAGIDLDRHHVLSALANTRHYADPADPEITRFEQHFADARYSARSRASAGFALAKSENDLADHAAAARTLRAANAMVHAAWRWDGEAWQKFVAAREQESVVPANASPDPRFVPVFIVGLPRSGTTLSASLLARASGARDRGELRALRFISEQLVAGGHLGSRAALAEAAGLYRKLSVQDDAPAMWYLDQDPLNFRYLHVAAAMFPQARVIHLRRDRRDTALSLWSQDFAHPDLAFAYDFAEMRAYMAGHDTLMRHWTQDLPLPIFELDYEALVTEPDAMLAKLRGFLGAPEIAPATKGGSAPVQSASVWQARQPVYTTSIGRWRQYAPHVPELATFKEIC